MNVFSKKQITKKFILVLVLLILFKFMLPLNVKADEIFGGTTISDSAGTYNYEASNPSKEGGFFDIGTNFTKLLFLGERAIIGLLNDIFCDDGNKFLYGIQGQDIVVKNLNLTPENIIKGSFVLFDADIFKNIADTSKYFDAGKTGTVNGKMELRNTVAGWYYAIRNLAIVALLSVLVYVGIRMITSTISQDKAKYKVMLKDWLVALCLVVVMHYIMITILNLSSMITDAIAGPGGAAGSQTEVLMKKIGTITEADKSYTVTYDGKAHDDVRAIMVDNDGKLEFYDIGNALAFMLLLLVIIFYTGLFAVKYLKREFTIIFLVLLAPISAVTYPIDKISDGKAQAFNKWFYEFLYNVIIQPFHLLIYIVLVGSATQLADDNILYSIICFAVMIPAEKFIKKMFGFRDELGSPLGAFTLGAIASQSFSKSKAGSSSKSGVGSAKDSSSELPAKVKDVEGLPGAPNGQVTGDENVPIDGAESDPQLGSDNNQPENIGENDGTVQGVEDGEGNDINNIEGGSSENGTSENSTGSENPNNNIADDQEKGDAFSRAGRAIRDRYDRKLLKKYGTTKKGELAKKRLWRATKGVGKFAGRRIKEAVTFGTRLAGAAALGTVGAMIGKGKEGAALGIGLGGKIGNTAGNLADRATSTIGEYAGTGWKAAFEQSSQKEKYKTDINNIDRARRNVKDRNDGRLGTHEEVEKELENMFKMQQYGVKDAFLDGAMDKYNELVNDGMNEDDALSSSVISSLMAQDYSADKMRDPKAMQKLYDDYYARYKSAGVGDAKADELTRKLMQDAGELRGVQNVALPPIREKVIKPTKDNMYGKLKLGNDATSETQKQEVNAIQDVLIEIGLDDNEIKQVMEYSTGGNNEEIITSFAENVKYIISNNVGANTQIPVGEIKSGTMKSKIVATKKEQVVMKDNIEKLDLRKQTGVTDEKVLSKMRELEERNGTTKFRAEGGKMIRGEFSKNDKNNLSEKALEMAEGYKRAYSTGAHNAGKSKKKK